MPLKSSLEESSHAVAWWFVLSEEVDEATSAQIVTAFTRGIESAERVLHDFRALAPKFLAMDPDGEGKDLLMQFLAANAQLHAVYDLVHKR